MSEIIHVKCGLEGCNSYYDYNLQENEIAALEAEWKIDENIEPENINLWGQMPKIGQVHEVTIRGAIKIDLSQSFWVFYQDPIIFHEDFETEETFIQGIDEFFDYKKYSELGFYYKDVIFIENEDYTLITSFLLIYDEEVLNTWRIVCDLYINPKDNKLELVIDTRHIVSKHKN